MASQALFCLAPTSSLTSVSSKPPLLTTFQPDWPPCWSHKCPTHSTQGLRALHLGLPLSFLFLPTDLHIAFSFIFLGVSSNDTKQRGFLCFPCIKEPLPLPGGSDGKESACGVGDLGSIPGSGRSPREGNGYPFQYSCLEKSTDREALRAIVRGVTRSLSEQLM